jgi:hypothetical protein
MPMGFKVWQTFNTSCKFDKLIFSIFSSRHFNAFEIPVCNYSKSVIDLQFQKKQTYHPLRELFLFEDSTKESSKMIMT